jgi:hypothetical protein
LKGEIVDALGPVQICIDLRLIEIVEEKNFPIASEEWLHGVAVVATDSHALGAGEFRRCDGRGSFLRMDCCTGANHANGEKNAAKACGSGHSGGS